MAHSQARSKHAQHLSDCRGTLGAHDLKVGDGCRLLLAPTGTTRGTHSFGQPGIYEFDTLTVKADGEVTHLPNAPHEEQILTLMVRSL